MLKFFFEHNIIYKKTHNKVPRKVKNENKFVGKSPFITISMKKFGIVNVNE